MLRIIAAVLTLVLATSLTAKGALLAYEGFDYPSGGDLAGEDGGIGWSGPWTDYGSGPITLVSSPGLSYPGLASLGNAASTPAGAISTYPRQTTDTIYDVPGTTLYYSLLLRPDAGFGFYGGLNIGGLFFGASGNQTVYGLEGPASDLALSSTPIVQGADALLVVQANFGTVNDTFNLYVDPSLPGAQPAVADATLVLGVSGASNNLYINNAGGWSYDELRIGTTYADVVPVPEPAGAVLLGATMGSMLVIGRKRRPGRG